MPAATLPLTRDPVTFDAAATHDWIILNCPPDSDSCDIQPDYEPRVCGHEGTTFSLVEEAFNSASPAISLPPGYRLTYTAADDTEGGTYTFTLSIALAEEWNTVALTDYWYEQRKIGEPGLIGVPAAVAVLQEATFAANRLLHKLTELTTCLTPDAERSQFNNITIHNMTEELFEALRQSVGLLPSDLGKFKGRNGTATLILDATLVQDKLPVLRAYLDDRRISYSITRTETMDNS